LRPSFASGSPFDGKVALAVVYFARCHIHNDFSELIGVAWALFSKTCHRPNYRILQNSSPVAVNPPSTFKLTHYHSCA
ncbi:MAG: hypothetical protein QF767_03945, partial [Alphaproteobacteria bacterium]|nr:hypothetical protein [Alphaproteobacteria bacterium]